MLVEGPQSSQGVIILMGGKLVNEDDSIHIHTVQLVRKLIEHLAKGAGMSVSVTAAPLADIGWTRGRLLTSIEVPLPPCAKRASACTSSVLLAWEQSLMLTDESQM